MFLEIERGQFTGCRTAGCGLLAWSNYLFRDNPKYTSK